ncbi:MAG: hypothetical protein LUC24_04755, partial [Bacteroidales bacterium]|nr:hypothetical protein [Bacteroidales bacterium]
MKKTELPRNYKVYIVLVVLLIAMVLLMPRTGRFNYDYRKGSPWMYETLIAAFDFPVLKTDEQLQKEREAAGSGVVPYYKYSNEEIANTLREVGTVDLGDWAYLSSDIRGIFTDIYSHGVMDGNDNAFTDESVSVIYVQKDKRATKLPVTEVYKVSEARSELLFQLTLRDLKCDVDSLCSASGLYDMLVPNLIFDQETTELVHDDAVDYISPTSGVVRAGQLIVSNGEMVTAEIQQLLDSYKAEYEASLGYDGPMVLQWAGNFLIAIVLILVLFLTIFFTNPKLFSEFNTFLYLIVIYFLTVLITLLVER